MIENSSYLFILGLMILSVLQILLLFTNGGGDEVSLEVKSICITVIAILMLIVSCAGIVYDVKLGVSGVIFDGQEMVIDTLKTGKVIFEIMRK